MQDDGCIRHPTFSSQAAFFSSKLALVSRIVIRMQRRHTKEVAIAIGDRANPLTQSKRVHSTSGRRLQMLEGFPVEARMAVKTDPIELA